VIKIWSEREIAIMRKCGRTVAKLLETLREAVRPGVSTGELDRLAEAFLLEHGVRPAFKGYRGYPATICTSVNEQVVHGLPGERVLREGDIISIDVGACLDGYFSDAAMTFPVGEVDGTARRLLEVCQGALWAAIRRCIPGNHLSDISHTIQRYVESRGYSVVRDYAGHGIGTKIHDEPQIPNYGPPGQGPRLRPGMVLAIEPMVNVGTWEVMTMPDGWTVVTRDGKLSAHFEHVVAITDNGAEVLTLG